MRNSSKHLDFDLSSTFTNSSFGTSLAELGPATETPSLVAAVCILPFLSLQKIKSKFYLRLVLFPPKSIFQVKTKVRA